MQNYVTGGTIRALREARRMTQAQLAEQLGITDQAVSKWDVFYHSHPRHAWGIPGYAAGCLPRKKH